MDCMEYMKGLKDNEFDLAIVDPPYGIGESGTKAKGRNRFVSTDYKSFAGDDINPPNKDYFIELQRVSKNQVVWGANHFMQNIHLGSSCWIVWDKLTGDSDFADCELAYTSFKTAVRKFQFRCTATLKGRAHDCTRHVYAAYACAAHNVKLLGEDANFDAKADLVFIRDVKSGDEAGRRLQGSEVPRQLQTFLL